MSVLSGVLLTPSSPHYRFPRRSRFAYSRTCIFSAAHHIEGWPSCTFLSLPHDICTIAPRPCLHHHHLCIFPYSSFTSPRTLISSEILGKQVPSYSLSVYCLCGDRIAPEFHLCFFNYLYNQHSCLLSGTSECSSSASASLTNYATVDDSLG